MASSQGDLLFPFYYRFVPIAKYAVRMVAYSPSDQHAPLYERLIERAPKYTFDSDAAFQQLSRGLFPQELDWVKDEAALWFFEQRLRLESPCNDFLSQDDIGILFNQSYSGEIRSLCKKQEDGKMIVTPQYWLENFYALTLLYNGRGEMRERFLQKRPFWPDVSKCLLNVAVFLGENRLVDWLLDKVFFEGDGGINYGFITVGPPLFAAVAKGVAKGVDEVNEAILRRLLSLSDIDPNISNMQGYSLLYLAAEAGRHEILDMLLQHPRIQPNFTSGAHQTPLRVAISNGNEEAACSLLKHQQIDPNLENGPRDCPLLVAAARDGLIRVVDLLLRRKDIDVNVRNQQGDTALSIAATNGNRELVQSILHYRSFNVNYWEENLSPQKLGSKTFLFHVHDAFIMNELLKGPHFELINIRHPETGRTILMEACNNGNTPLVMELANYSPNYLLYDNYNLTALDYAKQEGHQAIVDFLHLLQVPY